MHNDPIREFLRTPESGAPTASERGLVGLNEAPMLTGIRRLHTAHQAEAQATADAAAKARASGRVGKAG